jgi:membrane protein YqaA with SNARE-associated domain
MEEFVAKVLEWFALPKNGLASVFVVAFVSATLLPLGSEPAVFGYLKLNPEQFWLTIVIATIGNTLGGVVDYWLGRGAKKAMSSKAESRYLKWFKRLGPKAMFFSFLPAVGDPLCAVGGWLRLPFWQCVAWMTLGKFARYVVMTTILLAVPDDWWMRLIRSVTEPLGKLFGF